jgi:hypothetical protein
MGQAPRIRGDVAALTAALFAFLALRLAYETIADASNDRREAERDRQRDRIEHVGEILEAMASAAQSTPHRFAVHRNRLGLALASLRKQLPKCSALFDETMTPDQFKSFDISAARQRSMTLSSRSATLSSMTLSVRAASGR